MQNKNAFVFIKLHFLFAVTMINSEESLSAVDECDSLTVISGRPMLATTFGECAGGGAAGVEGAGAAVSVDAIRLLLPHGLLLVCVAAGTAKLPPPPPSSLLLSVVVVVVVATMVARESKFIVILKCFFWTCVRISWTREKARSHTGHLVLPECMSRCRVSDMGWRKPFQHTLHRNWNGESARHRWEGGRGGVTGWVGILIGV